MQIKKLVPTVALLMACLSAVTVNGFAHCPRSQYAVCPQTDCADTAYHTHDGETYRPHYSGDGHDYHTQSATYYGYGGCHR